MTKEMFDEITSWQRKIFTKATSISAAHHLNEEVVELLCELNDGHTGYFSDAQKEKIRSEYADCFLLLFGSASLFGLSYEQICEAINDKMEINKQRKWGGVNEQGYVKHVE
jgi:NTP pyrophosphatase (non-canonical NTP hydrolase)